MPVIITNPNKYIEKEIGKNPNNDKVIKLNGLIDRKNQAKSFRGFLKGMIAVAKHEKNVEVAILLEEIMKKYKEYESIGTVEIGVWKGKSSIEVIKKPGSLLIVKWQKPNKFTEPRPNYTKISKTELNALIYAINQFSSKKKIKSKEIAGEYCKALKIERNSKNDALFRGFEFDWDRFFADRGLHNKLTLMLDALAELGLISYLGGEVMILHKGFDVQTVLN